MRQKCAGSSVDAIDTLVVAMVVVGGWTWYRVHAALVLDPVQRLPWPCEGVAQIVPLSICACAGGYLWVLVAGSLWRSLCKEALAYLLGLHGHSDNRSRQFCAVTQSKSF